MKHTRRPLAAAALAAALPRPAPAQGGAWPRERPLTVLVPQTPGGGVDQMVRMVMPHLQQQVADLRFVVEYRPGAGSQTGTEAAYGARPDGYTLCATVLPTLMSLPLERRVRYDARRFTYIANVVEDPGGLWVTATSRFRDLPAMMEAARASRGAVSLGTTGVGSDDHQLIAQIQRLAPEVRFNHVPFNGFAPLQTALLGGHIEVACFNMTEGLPGVRDGRLRCLALAAAGRPPAMGDVPTLREGGYDVVASSQRGIIAPPGLPDDVRDRLVAGFGAALASPGFRADAARLDLPVVPVLGEAFRAQALAAAAHLETLWQRAPWRDD